MYAITTSNVLETANNGASDIADKLDIDLAFHIQYLVQRNVFSYFQAVFTETS